jgi:hypothetical protein
MNIVQLVPTFPKAYKYTLGSKLQEELIELISLIFKANVHQQKKTDYLQQAREHLEVVRLLFRLANDLKLVDLKQFVNLQKMIESVSKQLYGWQKSCV